MFHRPKFPKKLKSPQSIERQDEKPAVTLETAERLAHEAYTKAFADAKGLFDSSLQIDQKMATGIKQVNTWWRWYIGLFSAIATFAAFFGVPRLIKESVTEKYVGDEVQRQINQFTDTKVSTMIVTGVSNTEERVKTAFTQYMDEKVKSFEHRSEELDGRIKEAESLINVYEKCASARAGNRKDYEFLVGLSEGTNRVSHVASSTVEEINKSFEQKKNTFGISRTILVNKNDQGKKVPEDILIVVIYNDFAPQYEGAINNLADKAEKKYVATLIHAVMNSQYLDCVYAAIRGVEKMTGQSFPALGIQETLDWWALNESNNIYHCAFEHYIETPVSLDESADDNSWRKAEYLYEWIREMPNQFYSASQVIPMMLFAKVEAEKEEKRKEILDFALEYWGKENPKAVDWYVFKTAYFVGFDMGQAVGFVNDRLREHPQFEEELRHGKIVFPSTFFEISGINWPSKVANNEQDATFEKNN